jgi:hypothetical protein
MKRRTFLFTSGSTLASLLIPSMGRANPAVRAAIVIGVDKAGNLPVLRAAASGATEFANWLSNQGFDVFRFIDTFDPVKVDPIFETVDKIVNKEIYEQLVIYFSGHGFLNSYKELWMLSGAPNNPNQAISLPECKRLCKRTGISNVVFISDACRSVAPDLAASSVTGSVIFPSKPSSGNIRTKVDIFLATEEGDPSYEIKIKDAADQYHGIYTTSFLDAFKHPMPEMVTEIEDGAEVILNKNLEKYLERDVNRRAQEKSISLKQRPVAEILSDKYIGRVIRERLAIGGPGNPNLSLPPAQPTIGQVAFLAFKDNGFEDSFDKQDTLFNKVEVRESGEAKAFEESKNKLLNAHPPLNLETRMGLSVSGIDIVQAATNPNFITVQLSAAGSPSRSILELDPIANRPASVAIKFTNGYGTVVAAFPGYYGTIVVDNERVVSVSYDRHGSSDSDEVKELRALVATSARFGTFRIGATGDQSDLNAEELADRIRVAKSIDPTLGIYAAYAYEEADLHRKIQSVREYLLSDLRGEIYDIAMLAGVLENVKPSEQSNIAPFCPMLSQGWGLLRIGNIILPPVVAAARDYLEPALWTTFKPEGIDRLLSALTDNRLH